ncbi:TPA: alpha/beta hydrolase fold domain-containing protein [Streptococcus suis]
MVEKNIKPLCPPEVAPRYEDIPYAEVILDNGDKYTLKMDIYQNSQQVEIGPTIVYIFGGGFLWGEYKQRTQKAVYCRDLVRLTEKGYTIVCPDYRLASQSPMPACIYDLKCLIRFLKAMGSEYLIDAERIGVLGNSAGGHLASFLALTGDNPVVEGDVGGYREFSSKIKAAVSFYGTSDLCGMLEESAISKQAEKELDGTEIEGLGNHLADKIPAIIVGYKGEGRSVKKLFEILEKEDSSHPDWSYVSILKQASPINYVHSGAAPLLLLHGGQDQIVPISQSIKLFDALLKVGADVTLIQTSKGGHGPSLGKTIDFVGYQFLIDRL